MPDNGRDRDLILPPGTYAYVLDTTKGKVSVYVGPTKSSLSNTDRLVVYNSKTKRFQEVDDTNSAALTFVTAEEGQYVVLSNPVAGTTTTKYPTKGNIAEPDENYDDTNYSNGLPHWYRILIWP